LFFWIRCVIYANTFLVTWICFSCDVCSLTEFPHIMNYFMFWLYNYFCLGIFCVRIDIVLRLILTSMGSLLIMFHRHHLKRLVIVSLFIILLSQILGFDYCNYLSKDS
jgi:hypothetical protein